MSTIGLLQFPILRPSELTGKPVAPLVASASLARRSSPDICWKYSCVRSVSVSSTDSGHAESHNSMVTLHKARKTMQKVCLPTIIASMGTYSSNAFLENSAARSTVYLRRWSTYPSGKVTAIRANTYNNCSILGTDVLKQWFYLSRSFDLNGPGVASRLGHTYSGRTGAVGKVGASSSSFCKQFTNINL